METVSTTRLIINYMKSHSQISVTKKFIVTKFSELLPFIELHKNNVPYPPNTIQQLFFYRKVIREPKKLIYLVQHPSHPNLYGQSY